MKNNNDVQNDDDIIFTLKLDRNIKPYTLDKYDYIFNFEQNIKTQKIRLKSNSTILDLKAKINDIMKIDMFTHKILLTQKQQNKICEIELNKDSDLLIN